VQLIKGWAPCNDGGLGEKAKGEMLPPQSFEPVTRKTRVRNGNFCAAETGGPKRAHFGSIAGAETALNRRKFGAGHCLLEIRRPYFASVKQGLYNAAWDAWRPSGPKWLLPTAVIENSLRKLESRNGIFLAAEDGRRNDDAGKKTVLIRINCRSRGTNAKPENLAEMSLRSTALLRSVQKTIQLTEVWVVGGIRDRTKTVPGRLTPEMPSRRLSAACAGAAR